MIQTNLVSSLGLNEGVADLDVALAPAPKKKSGVLLLAVAGLVLGLGGAALALNLDTVMALAGMGATQETASATATETPTDTSSIPLAERPANVTDQMVGDLPLTVPAPAVKTLSGEVAANAAVQSKKVVNPEALLLGLGPVALREQTLSLLKMVKETTPTSVRFAQIVVRAPNYVYLSGIVSSQKDLDLWTKNLGPRFDNFKQLPTTVVTPGQAELAFAMYGRTVRPQSSERLAGVPVAQVRAKVEKAAKALGAQQVFALQYQSEGEWSLFEAKIPKADFDGLQRQLQTFGKSNPDVGVAEVVLLADGAESLSATLRLAVRTR